MVGMSGDLSRTAVQNGGAICVFRVNREPSGMIETVDVWGILSGQYGAASTPDDFMHLLEGVYTHVGHMVVRRTYTPVAAMGKLFHENGGHSLDGAKFMFCVFVQDFGGVNVSDEKAVEIAAASCVPYGLADDMTFVEGDDVNVIKAIYDVYQQPDEAAAEDARAGTDGGGACASESPKHRLRVDSDALDIR